MMHTKVRQTSLSPITCEISRLSYWLSWASKPSPDDVLTDMYRTNATIGNTAMEI